MDAENLLLKIRIFLLAWLHLRSQNGPVSLVKRFSYKDIKKATDGFRRITDNSSRGNSYKARFQNGGVATIKEVKGFDECDDASFYREVQLLGRLHHRHIVALSGFSTGPKRYLVFENVERGSLKEHLSDPLKTPLNWRTRLQIVIGIAAALEYLLFFCDPPVYHVSISSSTIMLDENLTPKLSDISLIRSAGNQVILPNPSSCIKECTGQTCKNIIFQLGLLILELITGQSSERNGADLVQWVQETYISRSINKIMDPDIGNNYNKTELRSLLNVARLCIKSMDKPKIYTSQILWYLQKKALARFQEVTNRYNQEKQSVDELLKQRDSIHSSFTVSRSVATTGGSGHFSNGSSDFKSESLGEEGSSDMKDKSSKKKWFNLNLKGSDKK